jgi:hypothetical protein
MNKLFVALISIILIYFNSPIFAQSIYDTGNTDEQAPASNQPSKQKPAEYKSKVTAASEKVMTALSQELQQQLSSIPNTVPSPTLNSPLSNPVNAAIPPSAPISAPAPAAASTAGSIKPNPLFTPPPAQIQTPSYTGFGSGSQNTPAPPENKSKSSQFSVY